MIMAFINLFVDILYAFVDPRIRSQYTRRKTPKKKLAAKEGVENVA